MPGGVLDDQLISVADGLIQNVHPPHPGGIQTDVDSGGRLRLPGLVDLHSDVLAKQYRPRPGASLPVDLTVQSRSPDSVGAEPVGP